MIVNCRSVTPGDPLSSWQKAGLHLVSRLEGGRDVVLAFDLTGSVNFNDEGRTRLRQIIEDSLQAGDKVYVIPFASDVNPLNPTQNSFLNPIQFEGKSENINQILDLLPKTSSQLQNTDIQKAEAFVYRGLAQQNQCRFTENKVIKPQSIVWITDAPLLTSKGITSQQWQETPANSPFRQADSPESRDRQKWIDALPLQKRSQTITANNNKSYELSIVDIEPIVQEFCTPAPGGKQICLVNSYLFSKLWLPGLLLGLGIICSVLAICYLISLQKSWKFEIKYSRNSEMQNHSIYLKNHEKIYLDFDQNELIFNKKKPFSTDQESRGYLERRGNRLFLVCKTAKKSSNAYKLDSIPSEIISHKEKKTLKKEFMIKTLDNFTLKEQDSKVDIQVKKWFN